MMLFFTTPLFGQLGPPGCFSYAPTVVTLHGLLSHETVPGPPNYTSILKGDKPETYWFITLSSEICVNEGKIEPDLNPAKKNIRRVQLILGPQGYEKHKDLFGKRVVASGKLSAAITGHHNTPVLLTVTYLELDHSK